MARKKRSSWVGPENPIDTSTNLQRPLRSMTSGQRTEALKDSPSVAAVKPRKSTEGRGKIGPRPKMRNVTRANLNEAGVREPKNKELQRGVTAVPTTNKPVKKRKAKGVTATGKKLDPTTGKIAEPKVGQAAKLEGKIVRVTPENVQQVYKEKVKTDLPTAGREEMTPKSPGPRVPLEMPRGGLRPKFWTDKKSGQVSEKLKGFAVPTEHVARAAWKAMGHLDALRVHQPGTKEYAQHKSDFHKTHSDILPMSKDVHLVLAMAHRVAIGPKYGDQEAHMNQIKDALSERISIGRQMEKGRAERQKASRGQA